MQRDSGQVQHLLSVLFSLLAVAIVCLAVFGYLDILYTKIDINQLSRQYILKMETFGYLTPQDRMEMEAALKGLGVEGISFAGTTLAEVGYGKTVTLQVRGTLMYQDLRFLSLFQAVQETNAQEITERRVSTAKN